METMEERRETYLELAGKAIREDRVTVEKWITDVCTECGSQVDDMDEDHAVDELEDGTQVLLVGCEGFFFINPNLIGMSALNWQDWTVEEEPKPIKEFTFTVPYVVVRHKTVTVTANSLPQATSNMLAAMLDLGLEVRPEWSLQGEREATDGTKLMGPITIKGYND
jgi:hypothetical protein